jgi:L-fucose isomerase-like protein
MQKIEDISKDRVSLLGLYSHAHPSDIMNNRIDKAIKLLEKKNIDINFIGYIADHDEKLAEKARKKLDDSIKDSSCMVLVYSGWSESTVVLRIISNFLHLPIIIWSLAGYYNKSGLIAPASAAGASLLKNTFDDLGVKYISVYDSLDKKPDIGKVLEYINLFSCLRRFRDYKLASFGYACSNLYPFMYDGSLIKKYTGIHIDNLDLLELKMRAESIKEKEISKFKDDFNKKYNKNSSISKNEINVLTKYYIALEKIIIENDYKGVSLKCGSGPGKLLGFTPCMLLSLIGEMVNTICEDDIYGLIAQTIINRITGLKPMFLEIFEFYENSILMASCGYAPFSLCKEDCISIYEHDWGNCGGLMNISELKEGKVTLFNLYPKNGKIAMQALTGIGKTPERFQEEGWIDNKGPKIPSLEIQIDADIEKFKEKITGPHYIIVHGDQINTIYSFCKFTGIELNIIQ